MNSGNVTMNPNDVNRILETKKREKLMRNNNYKNNYKIN
jgi:hypothetical protein